MGLPRCARFVFEQSESVPICSTVGSLDANPSMPTQVESSCVAFFGQVAAGTTQLPDTTDMGVPVTA